ncbi:DNA helicase [Tanacetum coccineum]
MLKDLQNKLLIEEKNYKRDLLKQDAAQSIQKLNHDQKTIYDLIIGASSTKQQELLFVYGHGGTDKTILWKTIISSLRSEGKIFLAVASSGIASLLLPEGRTTHSRFKLPLELTDESFCHAKKKREPKEEDQGSSWIIIPPEYSVDNDETSLLRLINFICDDTTLKIPTAGSLQEKAIVCLKNATADDVNAKILSKIKGQSKIYLSNDEAIPMGSVTSETELLYPTEYLNTITFPGLPPYELELKVGSPIILLRNVNLSGGLCNDTRMIVKCLMSKLIEAHIIIGIRVSEKNTAIQENVDISNINYFNPLLKLNAVYRFSHFIYEKTKPYHQTLENPISLKFGKITTFEVLTGKESEFPKYHFEFIAYNQLASRVPYQDENSKTIYPILTDYLGCIRSIGDVTPFGDANTGQKYLRKAEIENLDGNILEFTMWDEVVKQFNK